MGKRTAGPLPLGVARQLQMKQRDFATEWSQHSFNIDYDDVVPPPYLLEKVSFVHRDQRVARLDRRIVLDVDARAWAKEKAIPKRHHHCPFEFTAKRGEKRLARLRRDSCFSKLGAVELASPSCGAYILFL